MPDDFAEDAEFAEADDTAELTPIFAEMQEQIDTIDATGAVEYHDDVPVAPQRPSLFGRLMSMVGLNPQAKIAENEGRLATLSRVIRHHPDVAENYVLRGEVNLALKRYDDAIMDFETALASLTIQVKTDRWGLIAQVMQDRAIMGLETAQQHLS